MPVSAAFLLLGRLPVKTETVAEADAVTTGCPVVSNPASMRSMNRPASLVVGSREGNRRVDHRDAPSFGQHRQHSHGLICSQPRTFGMIILNAPEGGPKTRATAAERRSHGRANAPMMRAGGGSK
jgi:hypothetical protein